MALLSDNAPPVGAANGSGTGWLGELLAVATTAAAQYRGDQRELYRDAMVVEFLQKVQQALKDAPSSDGGHWVYERVRSLAHEYLDRHALSSAAAKRALPELEHCLAEVRVVSATLRRGVHRQGKAPWTINLSRKRIQPLAERVTPADMADLLRLADTTVAGASKFAALALETALDLHHAIRLAFGTELHVRLPIVTDDLLIITIRDKHGSGDFSHVRYLQERVLDCADKLEAKAAEYARALADARTARDGEDCALVVALATTLLEYLARASRTLDYLRTLVGA